MPRMRTIEQAYKEIRATDPNSAVSKRYVRQLIINGKVPSRKTGNKYLLNFDALEAYLAGDDLKVMHSE